jgi:hypothetical protein
MSAQANPQARWRALPLSLYARLTLLLLAGLLVAQGVSLWLQWDERTVVVEPQTARDRKKSSTLTLTMDSRIARPTAAPTPAGPPVAVNP